MLVQEAVLGGDLLERVLAERDARLAEREAIIVVEQVLSALSWLHSKRIIHGCAPAYASPLYEWPV